VTKRDLLLWTTILGPPSVWFLSLATNFTLAPLTYGGVLARRLILLLALVLIGIAGALAALLWRRTQADDGTMQGPNAERARAMAVAGVFLSVGFFLVMVAQSIPEFMLADNP
jgi:hypothetical protein